MLLTVDRHRQQFCFCAQQRGQNIMLVLLGSADYPTGEKEKKKKMFIKNKNLILQCLHTLVKTLNKIFQLKYSSDISCRKGEYVHKANFGYKIESTLIIRCTYRGYGLDVITKNTQLCDQKFLGKHVHHW